MATSKKKTTRKGRSASGSKGKRSTKRSDPKRTKRPKAADYLTDLRAMKGVDKEDYAFFDDPLAWTANVDEWLPTGSLAIDQLTGGGWPVGRIVEVAAWEGVGKSTLVDQSIAMAQRQGAVAVLIDTERSRDRSYMQALGVDTSKLIVHDVETVEDSFAGIDRVLALQESYIEKGEDAPPMLIVWDSLAATPTSAEREGASDDSHVAEAAKWVKQNLRRLCTRVSKARASLVITNQFYQTIGPFSTLRTYGGGGPRYYTSIRLFLTRKGQLKAGDRVVGHVIEAALKKTRVGPPRQPTSLGLIYGAGIHNAFTLYEWGQQHGAAPDHRWIKRAGAWTYLVLPDGSQEPFQGTFIGLAELLSQRPDVYQQMAESYLNEGIIDNG